MSSRPTLKATLVVGAALTALIPSAVVGLGSLRAVRARVIADATARYEMLAQQLAHGYEHFLESHRRAVVTLAGHLTGQPLDPAGVGPLLARTRAQYPAFSGIGVIDATGRLVAVDPPTKPDGTPAAGIDMSDREWFREVTRTRLPLVDRAVIIGRIRGTPTILVGAPVLDAAGRVRGVVSAGLELAAIQALADHLQFGKTGYAQAATADGAALAHRDRRYVQQRKDFSRLVQSSAHSLLDIINDIRDFSKIEAGRLDLEAVDFSLRDAMGQALKPLGPRAAATGVSLACQVRSDVPDVLVGDPGRLGQVVVNLVGNAPLRTSVAGAAA